MGVGWGGGWEDSAGAILLSPLMQCPCMMYSEKMHMVEGSSADGEVGIGECCGYNIVMFVAAPLRIRRTEI